LRQAHEKDGERSRMMVFSKRKSPTRKRKDEREEKDREEAAEFEMSLANIVQKRPDKRLKWLNKGMLLIGRKMIKPADFFELVMDKTFVSDTPLEVGQRMKASILANLHLFSSKQQKAFQSESCHFNMFSSAAGKERAAAKEPKRPDKEGPSSGVAARGIGEGGEGKRKARKRRAKDSRCSEDDFHSDDSRRPPPPRRPARRDDRMEPPEPYPDEADSRDSRPPPRRVRRDERR